MTHFGLLILLYSLTIVLFFTMLFLVCGIVGTTRQLTRYRIVCHPRLPTYYIPQYKRWWWSPWTSLTGWGLVGSVEEAKERIQTHRNPVVWESE